MRSVIFHIGGPKTGSSALQAYFHDNAARLRRKGISYENSRALGHDYAVSDGNGASLAEAIRESREDAATLTARIGGYFHKHRTTALISSESIAHFSTAQWRVLAEACARAGAAIKLIMFVRDVYPFYLSAYHQAVKAHGVFASFATFARDFPVDYHSDMIERALDVVGQENCHVFHYESRRQALDVPVLSTLGVSGDFDRAALTRRVNRRLTEEELRVLRSVNETMGSHYCNEISKFFVYNRPNEPTPEIDDPQVLSFLIETRSSCVARLNERFFDKKPVVQILAPRGRPARAGAVITNGEGAWTDSPEAQVMEWAVKRLEKDRSTFLADLRTRIARLVRDKTFANHPDLPPDFDPCAYLLLNEDLLLHEVPPYEHFVRSGRREGRPYRF